MPVTTTIAASSVAISAAANSRAVKAKKIACLDMVENYHGSEVVEVRQQYAECVGIVHPDPSNANDILIGKVIVAAFFVGIIAGLIAAALSKHKWDEERWVLYPVTFGILLPIAIIVFYMLAKGALFLFS